MDLGLRGRVALVTGSSQGIGREAAILLARQGARVAITYRNNKDAEERVAAIARTSGGEAANTTVNGEIVLPSGGHS